MATTIKKHITFPSELLRLAEARAASFGVGVAEYLRYLVIQDTKALTKRIEKQSPPARPEICYIGSMPVRSAVMDAFVRKLD